MPRYFVMEALLSKPYHVALELPILSKTLRRSQFCQWIVSSLRIYISLSGLVHSWECIVLRKFSYWWLPTVEGQRAKSLESFVYFIKSYSLNIYDEQGTATLAKHGQEHGLRGTQTWIGVWV